MSSVNQPKPAEIFKEDWDESWHEQQRGPFSDKIDKQNAKWIPAILFLLVLIIPFFCAIQPVANSVWIKASGPVWCKKPVGLNDAESSRLALDHCQRANLYYVKDHENEMKMTTWMYTIGYCHWVQLLMILQAAVFVVPNLLWICVQKGLGVDFGHFIGWARSISTLPLDYSVRHDNVRKLASELSALYFSTGGNRRRFVGFTIGRQVGIPIVKLYMLLKIVYLLLAIGQFLWLNALIGDKQHFWSGWHILRQLTGTGSEHWHWQESRVFSRVALCAVPSHQMSDIPHHILQCHLHVNTYIEKVFLFLWWFFLYVAFSTLLNIIYYYICLFRFFPLVNERHIRGLLRQREFGMSFEMEEDVQLVDDFGQVHLGREGMLLLWMIESNAGQIVAGEICAHLFDMYTGREMLRHRSGSSNPKQIVSKL